MVLKTVAVSDILKTLYATVKILVSCLDFSDQPGKSREIEFMIIWHHKHKNDQIMESQKVC